MISLKVWSQIVTTKQYENIELAFLQSQFVTAKNISKIRTLPYAFTRNGVGMLSSVLGSETAVDMNIRIMRAFTASQQIMESHAILYKRVKMDDNSPKLLPEQIFGTGCVWDAWAFVSDLVRSVKDMGVGVCAITKMEASPEAVLQLL